MLDEPLAQNILLVLFDVNTIDDLHTEDELTAEGIDAPVGCA